MILQTPIHQKSQVFPIEPGRSRPMGATPTPEGVNFTLFSRDATAVDLLLFSACNDPEPFQVISLDPRHHRTFHFWHVLVQGLKPGVHYAYRIDGPSEPSATGTRFDPAKVLIDPYALGNTTTLWDRGRACQPGDNLVTSMRSVVIDLADYDWEGDQPLNRPLRDTIIYEMHVGGFSKSAHAGSHYPGTFQGVIEKIPYLQQLGVTAVEMLPIAQFDHQEILRSEDDRILVNYWGYSTVSFFAPHNGYCVDGNVGQHIHEFRDMVKALHRAGIEVILDVVFNHSSEGNHLGPTISFKGLGNTVYYFLVPHDNQYYMDYSGCGNTINCNHPVVEKMLLECLEFWVREMHVDGFRFDEGSILSRGEDGTPLAHPPILWHIETNQTLSDTKIIAEAWDAVGLNQVGYFPGYRYAEWNGLYRDDIRRFVKGDSGMVGRVASRIAGSADIYEASGRLPINSVNFITCHDGFTLYDLVAYNEKHNWANGENNRDGVNENHSWNCGVEGPTDDPSVQQLRRQQIKNFVSILMLSQGMPMLMAGDEIMRTQQGNNNAYCQDNEINWFDWRLVDQNRDVLRFFQHIIAFRKQHACLRRGRFFTGHVNERGLKDLEWHGCELYQPGWEDPESRVLALTLGASGTQADVHIILNMYWDSLSFALPPVRTRQWYRAIDTSRVSPDDIVEPGQEVLVHDSAVTVPGRTVMVLISQ
jgi:isoamylase